MYKSISTLLFVLSFITLVSCEKEDNYSVPPQEVNQYFTVIRDKGDKAYILDVIQNGNWEIYAGTTPENIDMKQPISVGSGKKTITLNQYPSAGRMYFKYIWEKNSSSIASERLLLMEGAYNVRDLGGYATEDHKYVKWGKVFRSGDLNNLTTNDLDYLNNIGIKVIVDFRDKDEKVQAPDKTPESWTKTYELPINAGSVVNIEDIQTLEEAEHLLVNGNIFFVTDCQQQYRGFFQALMNEETPPILFHCSAGKDRAGFASALFLSSLGVDRETIIQDYLLSAEYVKDKYASYIEYNPLLAPVFTVKREYIVAAFETIDKNYGGMNSFLTNTLGVDIAKMKRLYTK